CRQLFDSIAGPTGARVKLLVSNQIPHPFACQGTQSFIVLPRSLAQGAELPALRWCLAHEWAHVSRGDLRSWYLAGIVRVVCFFQPLFWPMRKELQLCQVFLADAESARLSGSPEDYAQFLVTAVASRLGNFSAALGINGHRSTLSRRVLMLVE